MLANPWGDIQTWHEHFGWVSARAQSPSHPIAIRWDQVMECRTVQLAIFAGHVPDDRGDFDMAVKMSTRTGTC